MGFESFLNVLGCFLMLCSALRFYEAFKALSLVLYYFQRFSEGSEMFSDVPAHIEAF